MWVPKLIDSTDSGSGTISLPEYSGSGPNLFRRVFWLRAKSLSHSTLVKGPNPSPRILWLRSKSLSQSTLAKVQISPPEYSGSGTNPYPRVLWFKLKTLLQSTQAQIKIDCCIPHFDFMVGPDCQPITTRSAVFG